MFLLDNFEDYKYDVRAKRFNALQAAFPQFHSDLDKRAMAVKEIFDQTHTELQLEISTLDLPQKDLSHVVKSLLRDQLYNRAKQIFSVISPATTFGCLKLHSSKSCHSHACRNSTTSSPDTAPLPSAPGWFNYVSPWKAQELVKENEEKKQPKPRGGCCSGCADCLPCCACASVTEGAGESCCCCCECTCCECCT